MLGQGIVRQSIQVIFFRHFAERTVLLFLLSASLHSAVASDVSRQCARLIDCVENYEVCVKGVCTSASESSGLEPWVIGTIAISALLTVGLK